MVTRRQMKEGESCTLVINKKTRERLRKLSTSMTDTFDVVINKIADFYEKNH